ncbi:MAG: hypothetical protein ACYDBB_09205 [Armatimonadota bacterium]
MRLGWVILCVLLPALAGWALAPRAACWMVGDTQYAASLAGGELRLAQVCTDGVQSLAPVLAPGITTLTVGRWQGTQALLAARDKSLLHLDLPTMSWQVVGDMPAPIREILASPDTAGAVILTGTTGTPVPMDGIVWWASWDNAFAVSRVEAVKDGFRPWQCWWSQTKDEPRLAIATYKATHFAPFEHNCMFLFAWHSGAAEARWLGSRLTRPYLDATHADLRGDDNWRMVAVEVTRNGGHGISVYHPIGFGYENEWRTEAIPGLQRVAAYGDTVICWGRKGNKPVAWRLMPKGQEYTLTALASAPPSPEDMARLDAGRLIGWWNKQWQIITLPMQ